MTVDLYTKAVLTVIAAALCVLVFGQGFGPASALSDGCGAITDPCYVATDPRSTALKVKTGLGDTVSVYVRN